MTRLRDQLLATEYVLGALNDADSAAVRARMSQDNEFTAYVYDAQQLLADAEADGELPPPPGLLAAIEARIDAATGVPGAITVRHHEGDWQVLLPGVRMKMLHAEPPPGRHRYLVQMDPGARAPPHAHVAVEECVMLGGELVINGLALTAGDFHMVPAGIEHPELRSPNGALFYICGQMNLVQ